MFFIFILASFFRFLIQSQMTCVHCTLEWNCRYCPASHTAVCGSALTVELTHSYQWVEASGSIHRTVYYSIKGGRARKEAVQSSVSCTPALWLGRYFFYWHMAAISKRSNKNDCKTAGFSGRFKVWCWYVATQEQANLFSTAFFSGWLDGVRQVCS